MKFLKKHAYAVLFSAVLMSANSYSLLKTFVLPEVVTTVTTTSVGATTVETSSVNKGEVTQTESTYVDDNISVSIETIRPDDTTIYVADIKLADASLLKTALAQETYGTNITETTSSMAERVGAIFAINGDYYGANQTGYVIKNGTLYRDTARETDYEDLVQYSDGRLATISEMDTTAQELLESSVINTFTFGPTLVSEGEIVVSKTDEVGRAMADNPRTAIGVIEEEDGSLHYIVVVSDGRSDESSGLSLYELAQVMQSYGVTMAYNLDGGGSSTMYFNGNLINKPTTNGNTIKERAVSDIVYIGY